MVQSAAPKNRTQRTAIDNSMRPVDLTITRKPSQQFEVDQIPNSILLPVRNRRQQVMPEPHPSLFGSICQGIPVRSTKIMPARQTRSARRGRPPCGLGKGIGRSGSIKPHKVSGTSAAAKSRVLQRVIECRRRYSTTRGVLLQALSVMAMFRELTDAFS